MTNLKRSPCFKLWLTLVLTILALSFAIHVVNFFSFRYIGNNYFPKNTPLFALFCVLLVIGARLLNPGNDENNFEQFSQELLLFFLTMGIITIATNAVQLTPFPLIDNFIIDFESYFGFSLLSVLTWTHQYPWLVKILTYSYATLAMQMAFIPLIMMIVVFFKPTDTVARLRRYYCLMLLTTIIGFTIYYFFPTAAPATFIKSQFFTSEQYATGLKLMEIRQYITPSTMDGGLIAFPSHHVIWAILCLYLIYPYKIAFFILLLNNALLILSCVLLGWHYPTDILAALFIVWISFKFMKRKYGII